MKKQTNKKGQKLYLGVSLFCLFGAFIGITEKSLFMTLFYAILSILLFVLWIKQPVPQKETHPTTNKNNITNKSKHNSLSKSASDLKYEHNSFKFWFYNSYNKKATGERWVSKYEYKNIRIYRPDTSFKEIFPYDAVDVVQEPDNPFDNKAIAIKFCGNTLGYLYKGQHQDMANDFINRGDEVKAQIEKIDNDNIYLRLFFCKRRKEVLKPVDSFIVKLTGNGNEEMQGNIGVCSVGDEVSIEMDYEKEKYLVSTNMLDLGYIPKSKQEYMEQLEQEKYEFSGEITSITENDNEKYVIKIEIQPE